MKAAGRRIYQQNIRRHAPVYAFGIFTLLATSLAEALVPKFVQWILDLLLLNQAPKWLSTPSNASRGDQLDRLILCLAGVLLLAWCGRVGWRQSLARRTHRAGYELKHKIWESLRLQRLAVFGRFELGDLMSRATSDWNAARIIHGFTLVLTFDLLFFSAFAIIAMALISPKLTLISLLGFPILGPFVMKFAREEYRLQLIAQTKLSGLSQLISQTIASIRLQRATAGEKVWQTKLETAAQDYAKHRYAVLKTGWKIFPFGTLPTVITYAVLLTLGIAEIRAGRLSVGAFVALQSYVLLLQMPLFELADIFSEWQSGFAGMRRLAEIYELNEPELQSSILASSHSLAEPAIKIADLRFSYPGAAQPAVRDFNITIKVGERLGLSGPIGVGKSTVLKIIAGLLRPDHGDYMLFGTDSHILGRTGFSAAVALVPQKSSMFAGSVRFNLCLDRSYSEAELWEVLRLVQLESEVRQMAQGLDSWLGEGGINLSGGQRQRLALARAILRATPVLLLDDALSAVDAHTEESILGSLDQHLRARTLIWVAHRASSLKLCHRVVELHSPEDLRS